MDGSQQNQWKEVQESLQASMKQEINTMREMLSNMCREELTLLAKDKRAWMQVMLERESLLHRLRDLRALRGEATKQLEIVEKHSAHVPEEEKCEILSMSDQMAALIEKMNQQNIRNLSLEENVYLPTAQAHYGPVRQGREPLKKPSARSAIATYPTNERS